MRMLDIYKATSQSVAERKRAEKQANTKLSKCGVDDRNRNYVWKA
jgi:hypothetical protein